MDISDTKKMSKVVDRGEFKNVREFLKANSLDHSASDRHIKLDSIYSKEVSQQPD